MKIHLKFSAIFCLLVLLIFGTTSCSLFEGRKEYKIYTIPEGGQNSHSGLSFFTKNELRFLAKFDQTAIYSTSDPLNQLDANKLYGFSDCADPHHKNSARFGWRWYNNRLEILAYCYNNSVRYSQYITSVELDQEYEYRIFISEDQYGFSLNGNTVFMPRGCSKGGAKYHLFPFFGGDENAPHNITIRIKEF